MAFTIDQYYNNPKRKRPRLDAADVLELNVPPNLDEWETVRHHLSRKATRNTGSADGFATTDDAATAAAAAATDCDNNLYSTILLHLGYLLFHSSDDALIRSICSCWACLPPQDTHRTDALQILATLIQRAALQNNDRAETMLVCLQIIKKQRYCEENENENEDLNVVVKQLMASTAPAPATTTDDGVSLLDRAIQFIASSTTERILPDPPISKRPTVTDLLHDLGSTYHAQQRALHHILDYDPTTLMTKHHPQLLTAMVRCAQIPELHDSCLNLWLHLCQHHPYHATLLVRTPKVLDAIVAVASSTPTSSSASSPDSLNESAAVSAAVALILLLSDIVVNRSIMAHHGGLLTAMIRMVRTMNENKTKCLMKERILLLAAVL
jgi:hypothetical protein